MSDTFCILPFSKIFMKPNGRLSPCCKSPSIKTNDNPEKFILNNIQDAFNSDHMNRVRHDLLNGIKVKECQQCWDVEDYGGMSLRKMMNSDLYKDNENNINIHEPKIMFIEATMSNKCNLKCLMCFPSRSNQLGIEEGLKKPDRSFPVYNDIVKIAPNLRGLDFVGGEPLVQDEVYSVLDFMIENDYSKNIDLKFSTNGTTTKKEFFDKIKQFKSVFIDISIESVGARNEYIRFPSKWDVIEKNILYFSEMSKAFNMKIKINTVFNNMTVSGLHLLEEWAKKNEIRLTYNRLRHPAFMRSYVLPKKQKDRIYESLSNSYVKNTDAFLKEMMKPHTSSEKKTVH